MGTLREFLAEQAGTKESRIAEMAAKRTEWVRSLEFLADRIKGWIDEADEHHLLNVEKVNYPLREEGLGNYLAPGLTITLMTLEVEVKPIARYAAGLLRAIGGAFDSRTLPMASRNSCSSARRRNSTGPGSSRIGTAMR